MLWVDTNLNWVVHFYTCTLSPNPTVFPSPVLKWLSTAQNRIIFETKLKLTSKFLITFSSKSFKLQKEHVLYTTFWLLMSLSSLVVVISYYCRQTSYCLFPWQLFFSCCRCISFVSFVEFLSFLLVPIVVYRSFYCFQCPFSNCCL